MQCLEALVRCQFIGVVSCLLFVLVLSAHQRILFSSYVVNSHTSLVIPFQSASGLRVNTFLKSTYLTHYV